MSALQCAADTSSSFAFFCRGSLLTGFHFPDVQCIDIFVAFFLDDVSTREQFAFLVYCYRVKAIFHNLCTVLYWRLYGLALIVKYPPSQLRLMCMERRRFSQTMASEWQTAFLSLT